MSVSQLFVPNDHDLFCNTITEKNPSAGVTGPIGPTGPTGPNGPTGTNLYDENALNQIISPKKDYKIPKLENTVKEAS